MEGKIINLLHLARKACKLQFGFDACEKSCFKGKSRLVLYVSDLAENSKSKLINMVHANNTKAIEIGTKKLFGESFKTRDVGIISIEDHNFAKGIIRLIV